MNTKMIGIIVIVLVVLGGGFFLMQGNKSSEGQTTTETTTPAIETTGTAMAKNVVEIKDFKYNPATLTVKAGERVTFINKDAAGHSATADDKSFDTGVLSQGESETVTLGTAGTFKFHCTPHPNIQGTIVVE